MKISFHKVMPEPLSSIEHGDRSIWNATFSLEQGQKVVLNASSGKGKTTFTHTLAGIRKDYEGDLKFDDQQVAEITPDQWAKYRSEKISFVFQDLQLFPELTVQENLEVKNQLTDTFDDKRLKNMLEALEVGDKWDVPCKLLSMGQQQRVAIVRSLVQPFDWIILDEPFSHLDEVNTQKCLKMINERCDEIGAGLVLTTLGDFHGFDYDRELNL